MSTQSKTYSPDYITANQVPSWVVSVPTPAKWTDLFGYENVIDASLAATCINIALSRATTAVPHYLK